MIGIRRKTIFSTIKRFVGTEGLGACFVIILDMRTTTHTISIEGLILRGMNRKA